MRTHAQAPSKDWDRGTLCVIPGDQGRLLKDLSITTDMSLVTCKRCIKKHKERQWLTSRLSQPELRK